jgi:dTDP-4-dehydrorhamnose reductase
MRILLFGSGGQVGSELAPLLARLGTVVACGRAEVDLERPDAVRDAVRRERPDVVVNAAAYTAVDRAEEEPDRARRVNADAVGVMADEVARRGGWLVHYSTDYVFDGAASAGYVETDETAPLNVYGATKLAGERLVAASGCRHLIFRTSWVYSAHGHNFVRTMLRLLQERDEVAVVDDQIGAPTAAARIAAVTSHVLRGLAAVPQAGGIYHLAASGATSWHGFAECIAAMARDRGLSLRTATDRIRRQPSSALKHRARRPARSLLDTTRLRRTFGVALPPWQDDVADVIASLLSAAPAPGLSPSGATTA